MSTPVRWGILGTARIADKIAPAIQATPVASLVAVASRQADRAAQWAGKYGVACSYGDYQALLDDPGVDAVYIPLPPSLHEEWTLKAFRAGKHVLCEKPLSTSAASAAVMVQASREAGRLLMDGVMWRHHPRAAELKSAITDPALGQLRRITSAFTFAAEKFAADDLRFRRDLGGGALLDLGWYCVGAALWATDALPERVWATANFVNEVDRTLSGVLWFPGQVVASFDCSFDTAMRKWIEIAGSQGSVVCDDFTRPWNEEKARFWIHDQSGKVAESTSAPARQENCLIAEFCRRVLAGDVRTDWAETSYQVQRVCEALDLSARTGQVISLAE